MRTYKITVSDIETYIIEADVYGDALQLAHKLFDDKYRYDILYDAKPKSVRCEGTNEPAQYSIKREGDRRSICKNF